MNSPGRLAVMHVALNPATGPWSVMKALAAAGVGSGRYAGVALGVIADRAWVAEGYEADLASLGLPFYRATIPHVFGTAAFLLQCVKRPGIERWADDLARTTGADGVALHFHNAWMTGVFLPLRQSGRSVRSVVATFHGVNARFEGQPVRHAIHRWMTRRLLASHAALTSVDAANLDLARDVLGVPPERLTVIPNGVFPLRDPPPRPFLRARGVFTLGFVGSLTPQKGWSVALEATRRLRDSGRDVRLVLAGSGPDELQVRAMAQAHPESVTFLGRVRDARGTVMPTLDALAVMSSHEGLPMVIIEALSAGVPVIATRAGGIPEAVEDGRSGFLVPRDARALAAAVESLHLDPGLLERIGQGALQRFAERFDIRRIAAQYHRLYTGVSPEDGGGRSVADGTDRQSR